MVWIHLNLKGDNVRIKMDTEEMSKIASDLKASCEFVNDAIKSYQKYMDDTKAAAGNELKENIQKIRTGNYKHIKPSDIEGLHGRIICIGKI